MSEHDPRTHLSRLANGAQVLHSEASYWLGILQIAFDIAQTEPGHGCPHALFHLRELSYGNSVDPSVQEALKKESLLGPQGELDPILREVVLSAVRGEGKVLHLDSPFTDATDRAIHEYQNAREHLRSHLSTAEAGKIIRQNPVGSFIEKLKGQKRQSNPDEGIGP